MTRRSTGVLMLWTALGCGPPLTSIEGEDDVADADEVDAGSDATSSDSGESTDSESSSDDGSTSSESTEADVDTDATNTSESETSESETSESESETSESESETSESSEENTSESETGPIECETVFEGSVLLDQNSSPAEFAALECIEHITGDLELEFTTVENLEFLSALARVDGDLVLRSNDVLLDLHGLESLEHVGGELRITSHDALLDLHGLESLDELGGLRISSNSALLGLDGLSGAWHLHAPDPEATRVYVTISSNAVLPALDGLASVTSVTADLPVNFYIGDNPALVGDLAGLAGFASSDLDFALTDRNNPLESLSGLEGLTHARSIALLGTASQYTSLAGLDNLVSVEESLRIGICSGPNEVCADCYEPLNHFNLASLDGLESLQQVGSLWIWGNLVLTDIDALANLQTISDYVEISENPMLPQAAVDSLIANVEMPDNFHVVHNGTGDEPICGFIPQ